MLEQVIAKHPLNSMIEILKLATLFHCVLCNKEKVPITTEFREDIHKIVYNGHPGPVVQSIVSLTTSLVVKMLTVLVSTLSNSQIILRKKCE